MKYGISIALVLAALTAACARPDPAPVTRWTPPSASGATMTAAGTLRIERGDTLLRVARRYHLSTWQIIEANHMVPPYRLIAGAVLILPGPAAPMVAAAPPRYEPASYTPPPPSRPVVVSPAASTSAPRIASTEVPPADRPPLRVEPERMRQTSSAIRPATATLMPPPIPEPPGEASGRGFVWPVHGRVVAGFGIAANGTHNDGINIVARAGSPVHAAKAGEVVYVGNELRGYGNLVLIKHPGGYLTAYAHNSVVLVRKGDRVARGQVIARVGATGQVREPQLHFEIRAGRSPVNPTEYLPPVQQASAE